MTTRCSYLFVFYLLCVYSVLNLQIGFIMFYVRSPAEGGQESIAKGLSILWLVIYFLFSIIQY